jgi:hypothetical protein
MNKKHNATQAPKWLVMLTGFCAACFIALLSYMVWMQWESYQYEHSTPYEYGSPEWSGYRYAVDNELTSGAQCSDDPEVAGNEQFLVGCRKKFE